MISESKENKTHASGYIPFVTKESKFAGSLCNVVCAYLLPVYLAMSAEQIM
jgi:hypothetical protein